MLQIKTTNLHFICNAILPPPNPRMLQPPNIGRMLILTTRKENSLRFPKKMNTDRFEYLPEKLQVDLMLAIRNKSASFIPKQEADPCLCLLVGRKRPVLPTTSSGHYRLQDNIICIPTKKQRGQENM